jgi:hypothetical protein
MGVPQTLPTPLHCNNQSAIHLIKDLEFHCKTKHIELQYYFIHKLYVAKAIDLIYVASTNQLVDLFTKLLIVDETQHFHKFIGLAFQSCVPLNVNK